MAEPYSLKFIDIKRYHRGYGPGLASGLHANGNNGRLRVVGALDHHTEFEPADLDAAKAMMKWLANWMRDRHGFEYRIGIALEGGIVQSVSALDFGLIPTSVMVIDYDTEGADDHELTNIRQTDGADIPAYAIEHGLSPMMIEWPDLDA